MGLSANKTCHWSGRPCYRWLVVVVLPLVGGRGAKRMVGGVCVENQEGSCVCMVLVVAVSQTSLSLFLASIHLPVPTWTRPTKSLK